ncbi:hypothetical protein [Streptomyces boncukensis]|uniref:Uncharacterized protein n=1 Tax=Streptomyces boncukensis TaxID=2711219 RepID=A0A6G4X6M5_9ACTN|nr:hypothetical protein [Streptomyces boncukensis]NGO73186.1 hypothetical protein [Streptomyces boncukensis]
MALGIAGAFFFLLGLLLTSNYRGFTETALNVIVRVNPVTRGARTIHLRVAGGVALFNGAAAMLAGFSGAASA